MTQRRLRPSQGGRFLPPVVPSLLETMLVIERDEYVRAPRLLITPDTARAFMDLLRRPLQHPDTFVIPAGKVSHCRWLEGPPIPDEMMRRLKR